MPHSKTILVTGATDGLGRSVARHLVGTDVQLILHGRRQDRLDRTADEIAALGSRRPRTVLADFADLDQVRRMASELLSITDGLDVLINNAGIGSGEPTGRTRRTSADGFELRLAVNYLAGFLLTLELLPLLRTAAGSRVVNVASLGQYPVDFDDLMLERGYSGTRAYGQSKLAQIMFGFELAARLPAAEVTVNSLHPATYMPTKMVMAEYGRSVDTLEEGTRATARLAVDPVLAATTGRFFDRTREARADEQAYDREARRSLWEASLELTGAADLS